jgi:bifunctional DNA-binding transcriptional regulator/antitoxin component of YhaV-PrlF toxin-antitoxin module
MEIAMTSLAITVKGQVTLKRDLLQYLGIKPGERIEVEKMPAGELRLRAARPAGSIEGFIGILKGESSKVATIEEMNEAIAAGWVGEPCE